MFTIKKSIVYVLLAVFFPLCTCMTLVLAHVGMCVSVCARGRH